MPATTASQSSTTSRVIEALSANGFTTTASLAKGLGVGRDKIVDAFDEIEAAGMKLMRIRGIGGGAGFAGERARKAA